MLTLILLIVSMLCLLFAAVPVAVPGGVGIGWLGLALFVLTFVLKAGGA